MRLMPNVTKRRGVYYFQRWGPDELRQFWPKKYIRVSLGTTEPREANRLAAPLVAEWDEKFQQARDGTLRRYSDDDLESLAMAWSSELRATIEAAQELQREGFQGDPISDEDRELPIRDESDLDTSLRLFLDRVDWAKGPAITPGGADYRRLRELAFDHHYHSQVVSRPPVLERLQGQPVKMKPGDGPGFLETFETYLVERGVKDKTASEFRKSVTDFLTLHGDIPIRDLTKAQVIEYKNLLLRKPKRLTPAQRKINLRELVQSLGDESYERITAATVNKALVPVQAVLGYAVDNGLIDSNPAQGVKASRAKSTERKRLPYSADDMNLIVASLDPAYMNPERFWLPMLGMFTGARLEELAQLYVTDVQDQDGISFLNIAAIEEGQSVKNLASIRRVPIHPDLIKIGFLDFVKRRQKARVKLLFDLSPYRGVYSHNFSKWYGRHLRTKVGITDTRKVFHSFRHSFKDAGREAGIESALVDALQGHTNGGVAAQYGSGYSLKALDRAMRRVKFPGINLAQTKRGSGV